MALALGVVGMVHPANAEDQQGGGGGEGVASMRLQLKMADPDSYDHAVGGGDWASAEAEQQFPPDYLCDDIVSFIARIDSTTDTGGGDVNRVVQMSLVFDAVSSGTKPGLGYSDVVGAYVLESDAATTGNKQSVASIEDEGLTGPLFTEGSKLYTTIQVTDITAPETIIVRIDVRVSCSEDIPQGGLLYAGMDTSHGDSGFRQIVPTPVTDLGTGQNRVQLLQPPGEGQDTTTTEPPATTTTSTTQPEATTTTLPAIPTSTTQASSGVGQVTVTKVADKAEAGVGEVIGYTITVLNSGSLPLTDVLVDDPRAGFTTTIANLGPGETAVFTPEYTVTSDDLALGEVINGVTVSGADFDPAIATATTKIVGDVVLTGVSVLPLGRLVATTVPTAVAGSTLPRTGSDSDRMTWWAAALLVAGAAVLTAANGRRDLDNRRQG